MSPVLKIGRECECHLTWVTGDKMANDLTSHDQQSYGKPTNDQETNNRASNGVTKWGTVEQTRLKDWIQNMSKDKIPEFYCYGLL